MLAKCYRRYREPLTERHVQAIWYDRDMRPEGLVTRRGSAVRVIHPGDWNLGAGPDFRGAVLEIGPERRRLEGDVEVHLSPLDWDYHRHGNDRAYDNVIAHVTWGCGPIPESLPAGAVSIWLGRFVTANPGFSPDAIDLGAYPFARLPTDERPCRERLKDDPDLAAAVLSAAGDYRLRAKARRLESIIHSPGRRASREQIFYSEIMNALGYRKNSSGFRSVAAAVPYRTLVSEPENASAAFIAAADFAEWNRVNVRPNNAPEIRLAAAAELFTKTAIMDLRDADRFTPEACRAMIGVMTDGGFVGRGRAAAVLANVIAPFACAEERIAEFPEWLPPEDISQPVRLTAFRLFGRDHNPAAWYSGNGLHIQGLLQIHRDFCLQVHPDCAECRLIEELGGSRE